MTRRLHDILCNRGCRRRSKEEGRFGSNLLHNSRVCPVGSWLFRSEVEKEILDQKYGV